MGFYVPVWEYAQVDGAYVRVVSEMTEQGWEPFAASVDHRIGAGFTTRSETIVHLRRPTGRSVRVGDDD